MDENLHPGLEVIKLEFILKLKIKRNDWLLVHVSASSQSLRIILMVEPCSKSNDNLKR